jgi:hypothetical protein
MKQSVRTIVLPAILAAFAFWRTNLAWAAAAVNATPERGEVATNAPGPPMPPVPKAKSPVDFFRELLAMNPSERVLALTNRPPEARKQILAKIREYEALRPDLRELRLKATELRWYLLPLISTPQIARGSQLAAIPEEDRKLVEDRLRYWDALPATNQASLLTNVYFLRVLTEREESSTTNLSDPRREFLDAGIRQWQALSEEERQNIKARFDRVFTLNAEEKVKVLRTLSVAERNQIQKTLRRFGQLPPAQRAQCIENFEKFANLSIEERQQFLKNADRWNLMTPDERQAWRDLVQKLQPQPPMPPLPPRVPKIVGSGTNRN